MRPDPASLVLFVRIAGDFSGVLRGRYELLWVTFALTVLAYLGALITYQVGSLLI